MALMVLYQQEQLESRQLYLMKNMKELLNYVSMNQKEKYLLLLELDLIQQKKLYHWLSTPKKLELMELWLWHHIIISQLKKVFTNIIKQLMTAAEYQ